MRKHQEGLSLIGTMIAAALVIGSIVLAMRTVPVYNEYFEIRKSLTVLATSAEATSPEAIRGLFDRRTSVNDIRSVSGADLVIAKNGARWEISVDWQRSIPLVANVSLLFQFSASSSAEAAASQ
ncbi:DUF4845 domain-containing protein [Niveibacterium sp. COAC-50]|uniref:DUF4845 domain-containing protein n=1 Tax=Niveibacterium sp. COAC-50 TaxID=2729384 RepID=UPI001555C1D6|nr:DUF4845 domain-containing protein [Niveibacterium sp. COAC-50]